MLQRASVSPPVRYSGGKWRIAPWIIENMPPHVAYVEPFCGGASILFSKSPSPVEVINDLNGEVVNFFRVLRERPGDLLMAVSLTPYSREELKIAYEPAEDMLEKARRFYVRSRQSFGSGEGEYSSGWRYQRDLKRGTSVIREWNSLGHLAEAATRLKDVQIDCDDALNVIRRFDAPKTLFYVDPPYLMSSRYKQEDIYAHEMDDNQHRELAQLLRGVQGMVLLSGYESDLYRELYPEWKLIKKSTKTNGNSQAEECLWISPNALKLENYPLFASAEEIRVTE